MTRMDRGMPPTKTKPKELASPTTKSRSSLRNKSLKSKDLKPNHSRASNFSFVPLDGDEPEEVVAENTFEDDTPKGLNDYEERYIAFVDILGFKNLIQNSKNDPKVVGQLISALDLSPQSSPTVLHEVGDVDESEADLRVHTFSDFVVASTKPNHIGLAVLSYMIWSQSVNWLSNSLLCRGGITKGLVLHRAGNGAPPMVFGPAFVEAYQLESTVADYPRVIFSRSVREDWVLYSRESKLGEKLPLLVEKCSDGPSCIDLFCHVKVNGFNLVNEDQPEEFKQMRAALERHLNETAENPGHHRKIQWLARKFNAAVLHSKSGDLRISDLDN